MKIRVDCAKRIGRYDDPTRWMNSTLRYVPPVDFPEFLESRLGKPDIMRAFITLDEYWDHRTGQTYPDYDIGNMRYPVSELHYPYDMALIVPAPSGTRFVDYLTGHSRHAKELLLNVRRYEREVSDGVISYAEYEDVFRRAVEYCKELAPNIRYIECCNEVDIKPFGMLSADEYVKIYLTAKRAIDELNEKHRYDIPLVMGGFSEAHPLRSWELMEGVVAGLAAAGVSMDFYSYHMYDAPENRSLVMGGIYDKTRLSGIEKLREIMRLHKELLLKHGLPERPVFIDEMGRARATGVEADSLHNAVGNIMYLGAFARGEFGEARPFPWCTFHNPELQISYTQYVLTEGGGYRATPNGIAIELLHSLAGDILEHRVTDSDYPDRDFAAIAVAGEEGVDLLVVNPEPCSYPAEIELVGLEDGKWHIDIYNCNHVQNNILGCAGKGSGAPEVSASLDALCEGGVIRSVELLDKDCFALLRLRRAR